MAVSGLVFVALIAGMMAPSESALSDAHKEALHQRMMEIGAECAKEMPIDESEAAMLKQRQLPDTENARCFLACMFRKEGIMDDSGAMSSEAALANAEKMFGDDPEQMENIRQFLHACKDVNSLAVSDGSKGCDRARHAFHCMTDHATKMGMDF